MYVYRRRLYTVVQFTLDVLSFWLIWRWSADLRILLNPLTERKLVVSNASLWLPSMMIVLLLWAAMSLRFRLYRSPQQIRLGTLAKWAAEHTLTISVVTVLATFFSSELGAGTSRIFLVCLVPVAFSVLALSRCLALAVVAALQRRRETPRIALVGDAQQAKRFISSLERRISEAICGIIVPEGAITPMLPLPVPVLGTTRQMAELINRERIDQAVILSRSLPAAELEHCKEISWRMCLPVSFALDVSRGTRSSDDRFRLRSRLQVMNQCGLQTVEVRPIAFAKTEDAVKRAFDFVLATLLLALTSPLLLAAALWLKVEGRGPAVERTLHGGKGGRHFHCLRFRTSESTRFGQFLLRWRLDELPQLLNILRGKMSFTGPAPLPVEVLQSGVLRGEAAEWLKPRSSLVPGLTGLWQIRLTPLSFEEMLRLDLDYLQTRSLALDLGILLRTPAAVVRGIRVPEFPHFELHLVADAS